MFRPLYECLIYIKMLTVAEIKHYRVLYTLTRDTSIVGVRGSAVIVTIPIAYVNI